MKIGILIFQIFRIFYNLSSNIFLKGFLVILRDLNVRIGNYFINNFLFISYFDEDYVFFFIFRLCYRDIRIWYISLFFLEINIKYDESCK